MQLATEDQLQALRDRLNECSRRLAAVHGIDRTVEYVRQDLHDDLVDVERVDGSERVLMTLSNGTRMDVTHRDRNHTVLVFRDGQWERMPQPLPRKTSSPQTPMSLRYRFRLSDVANVAYWLLGRECI